MLEISCDEDCVRIVDGIEKPPWLRLAGDYIPAADRAVADRHRADSRVRLDHVAIRAVVDEFTGSRFEVDEGFEHTEAARRLAPTVRLVV